MQETFDFGIALNDLKHGHKVARHGWNGKGMWLIFVRGKSESMGYSHLSFIALKTADDQFVPWVPSQTDMLAEDWILVA